MREVLNEVAEWAAEGRSAAVATVVRTWLSAPRQPGAAMAVSDQGEALGSVSGGCVEGAVYELGERVLTERVSVLQRYGVSDDDAFAVGLTCGGTLEVFVERVDSESFPEIGEVAAAVRDGVAVAVATVIAGREVPGARLVVWEDKVSGSLGSTRLDDSVVDSVRGCSRRAAARRCTSAPTVSGAWKISRSSSRPSPRRPTCTSSAPPTSLVPSSASASSSATA